MFKPGEKVVCTDNSGFTTGWLTVGKTYEVERVGDNCYVWLKGEPQSPTKLWRFERASAGKECPP